MYDTRHSQDIYIKTHAQPLPLTDMHMHAQTHIHTHACAHIHSTHTHKEGRESETCKVVANRYSTLVTELVMRFTSTATHVVLRCNCKGEFG